MHTLCVFEWGVKQHGSPEGVDSGALLRASLSAPPAAVLAAAAFADTLAPSSPVMSDRRMTRSEPSDCERGYEP